MEIRELHGASVRTMFARWMTDIATAGGRNDELYQPKPELSS